MKTLIKDWWLPLIIFIICMSVLVWVNDAPAQSGVDAWYDLMAGSSYSVYTKEQLQEMITGMLKPEDESKKPRCPHTSYTNQSKCDSCHKGKWFRVPKENPHDRYDYPNYNTQIIEKDGEKIGYYYLQTISSGPLKQAFDFFDLHEINHIIIEVHNPGGSLFDAWRMAGLMSEQEALGKIIETRVYGFAASAGFLIAISGTKGHRLCNTHAELMWHELWTFKMFDIATPSSKEEEARVLRHLQDTGNSWLATRCNLTKEEIDAEVHKREFWMMGEKAVEFGFMDGFLNANGGE